MGRRQPPLIDVRSPLHTTAAAVRFLQDLGRRDIASLISNSTYKFAQVEVWFDMEVVAVELHSPRPFSEAIDGLPEWDQKRIVEAIIKTHAGSTPPGKPDRLELKSTEAAVADTLLPDILTHRNQMVAIATGQGRIQDADDYYKARHQRIDKQLKDRGIPNPNPFSSLWDWYQKWKKEFPHYSERRRFINSMYEPLIAQIAGAPHIPVPQREPTGWERVDRAVEKARARMESARDEELSLIHI